MGMGRQVMVLLAMRDTETAKQLRFAMDDGGRCSVRIAADGEAALREARRLQPQVLVIDSILPGIDGLGVLDRLWAEGQTPCVIGGAMLPMAEAGFRQRGAACVLRMPWDMEALRGAILNALQTADERIDWAQVEEAALRAERLLEEIGMRPKLKGFAYLSCAAALACQSEARLRALGRAVYEPVAQRYGTTPQCVERLIRHAVESVMEASLARGTYGFFGNTIDPTRGKPTNAQAVAMLAERMRTEKSRYKQEK